MKKTVWILALCMISVFAAACGSESAPKSTAQAPATATTVPETTPPETTSAVTTEPTVITEPTETTVPTEPDVTEAMQSDLPYIANLYASCQIYESPTRDSRYVQSVAITGLYTIVAETRDTLGNLWGKLKSGVGWVILDVNTACGMPICSRCGTTASSAFLDDWEPGDLCFGCVRDDFHFGEGGGIFCSQCGADCSYIGVCEDGRCEDCHDSSYTTTLASSLPIYERPDENSPFVQYVGAAGIYTIVEEAWDANGNLWGKLKSGVGWVMLSGHEYCADCGTYH